MRYDPEVWPVFGLRIRTPRLELEVVTPELAFELGVVALTGVHDPATMPFLFPWTDAEPTELRRSMVQFHARNVAEWSPQGWRLCFGVRVDGELAGSQDVFAEDFAVLGTVSTGSWLAQRFQGRGIGTEMREAVLHLAFAGLGATRARTEAWFDNQASRRVTTRLGYRQVGTRHAVRRNVDTAMVLFELERSAWERRRRDDIELGGLTPGALAQLGVVSTR